MTKQKTIPEDLLSGKGGTRAATLAFTREQVDAEARTVELAFSSETPVERWYGFEVLDHKATGIRLERINTAGALLMDHVWTDQVGVVERAWFDAESGKCRAVVRFSRSARGEEIFQDVVDGIRQNISVGYRIHAAIRDGEKDGQDVYRVIDWEPQEISIVSVPADLAAGIGRSADADTKSIESKETQAVTDQTKETTIEATRSAAPAPDVTKIATEAGDKAAAAERQRAADILSIGSQYGERFPAVRDMANKAAADGTTVDAFRASVLESLATAPTETAEIGMSERETQRYSMVKAIRYLASPNDKRAREAAAFEIECSEVAAERNAKKDVQGLLVPFDVLNRDLTAASAPSAGNLIGADLQSGSFIELLRNALVLPGMGAKVLAGLSGDLPIPRQTGAATAYWLGEDAAVSKSDQTFDQVGMSPKTVAAMTEVTRKLLNQASLDVEALVQADLARVIGEAIQLAAINGTGAANQPLGIMQTTGVGSVVGGTNGAAPTWANIIALETAVSAANADVGTMSYLTNAKVRGKLKSTEKFGGSNGQPIWGEGANPLNGYNAVVTNAVPSNITKGTGNNLSAILFGNFADLIIGLWSGLDLTVDPYTHSDRGRVRIVGFQDVDVAVRHPESFAVMKDVKTV